MKIGTKHIKRRMALVPVALLAILFIGVSSCQKYLQVQQSTYFALLTTADQCQQLLDNYGSPATSPMSGGQDLGMNCNYPSDGEASADDYYLTDPTYGGGSYGINSEDQNQYLWQPQAFRSIAMPQWQLPYSVVYNSNLVLECVAKIHDGTPQATLSYLKGSALFFRSYAFWNVEQLYGQPYKSATAATDLGVPLRLASDINAKSVRASNKDTYAQIIGDLKTAAALMPATSSIASRPSKVAAYAMLARAYLSMADYPDALSYADSALQIQHTLLDYNTISTSSKTPFQRYNAEVIFQSVTYGSPLLQPGYGYGGNADIVPELLNAYNSNDLRRQIFYKQNISTTDYSTPNGTWYFTGNYDNTKGANLFNGLATDEMYLIRAEGYARAGNTNSAMADLNTLLTKRYLTGTYTNLTATGADDALNQILLERRKELVMRALRWTDLRRLNLETRFATTLSRTIAGTVYTLPPNDPKYALLIPKEVIQAASTIVQNPR